MNWKTSLRTLFFALLIVSPLFLSGMVQDSADSDQPFQLNNYTIVQPGEEASVTLYGPGEYENFYFRLLRITEPLLFIKTYIASGSFYQFDIWLSSEASLLDYVEIEKEWEEVIERGEYWETSSVDIGKIDDAGYYILQAFSEQQVAYCPVLVSNYALVYKSAGTDLFAYLANMNSGKFIPETEYFLINGDSLLQKKNADDEGIAFFKKGIPTAGHDNFYFYAKAEDEVIFNNPNVLYGYDYGSKYSAYIYTHQPVYRPGAVVKFNAILRQRGNIDFLPIKGKAVITVNSPKNTEIYTKTVEIDEFGTVSGDFPLDEEADLGNYTIYIAADGQSFSGNFKVEEYKKPEYKVVVTTQKQQYSKDGVIDGKVQADYYFGSPVSEGNVIINIYKKQLWFPWWWFSEYAWFYRGFQTDNNYWYGSPQLIATYDGELKSDGSFEFKHEISEPGEGDFSYQIVASVTDASRRSINGAASAFVTRGDFSMSVSSTRYFVPLKQTTDIKVNTFDFSMKPVKDIPVKLTIIRTHYDKNSRSYIDTVKTVELQTNEAGKSHYNFRPEEDGSYQVIAEAVDTEGKKITASNTFYVWENNFGYYSYSGGGVDIVTDKEVYNIGDTLRAVIFMPVEAEDIAVSFLQNEFIGYEKITAGGKVFEIKKILGSEHVPSFNIDVSFVKEGQMYNNTKLIGVLNDDRFLNVEIMPVKDVYKPGETAEYKIKITDKDGNPVPNAAFSFGSVDESIYAIQEETVQDIQTHFYSPQSYYSPTYFSKTQANYTGYSRYSTRYDQYHSGEPSKLEAGNASVSGTVEITNADEIFINTTDCKVGFFSKEGFRIVKLDSAGKYEAENLPGGMYDICIISPSNSLTYITTIDIGENEKHRENMETEIYDQFYSPGFDGFGERNLEMMVMEDGPPPPSSTDEDSRGKGKMKQDKKEMVEPAVRKDFRDAAFWNAQIITNAQGEAMLEFQLPDNLTSWRSTVRAFTKNTMVGQQTNLVIVRKELLLRTETPRFFREGDKLVVSTMIHNYLETEKETKITFRAENLKLLKGSVSDNPALMIDVQENSGGVTVEIGSKEEIRIDWLVEVEVPIGEAKIYAEALTNEESDAMELKVPILPYGIEKKAPLNLVMKEENGSEEISFNVPGDIDMRTVALSFTVNPTIGTTLLKSLDDLIGYPYGCVEQTMSRFLPAIIVANTFESLDLPFAKTETAEKLPDVIQKSLKRLYRFQHSDGGWGWWEHDQSNPFMSAYVLYGLSLAAEAGYAIDQNVINSGVYFLRQQLKNDDLEETTRAYMTYVYTVSSSESNFDEKVVKEILEMLIDKKVNPFALSLAGLTAHYLNYDKLTLQITNALIEGAVVDDFSAYWGGEVWHYSWQKDKVQTTAYVIKYLLKVNQGMELVEKAVPWLLRQQKGYSWHSTQQTAMVIFALTDYLAATNELNPDYTAAVLINGEPVYEKEFTSRNVMEAGKSLRFDAFSSELLKPGKNTITITKEGAGALYFSGLETHFSRDIEEPADSKFKITRSYYKLVPEQQDEGIIYRKEPVENLKSGDDIFVKVRVDMQVEELEYFMVEEMLPSGFEVVQDDHLYRIEDEGNYNQYYYDYYYMPWRWFYADKEVRDEKISFFVTYPTNSMEFTYIMKAQIPGSYTVMPAEAELMYYPEIYGSSLPYEINVKDK